jgi:hypothetical protein
LGRDLCPLDSHAAGGKCGATAIKRCLLSSTTAAQNCNELKGGKYARSIVVNGIAQTYLEKVRNLLQWDEEASFAIALAYTNDLEAPTTVSNSTASWRVVLCEVLGLAITRECHKFQTEPAPIKYGTIQKAYLPESL